MVWQVEMGLSYYEVSQLGLVKNVDFEFKVLYAVCFSSLQLRTYNHGLLQWYGHHTPTRQVQES